MKPNESPILLSLMCGLMLAGSLAAQTVRLGNEVLAEGGKFAAGLDVGFLWECSGTREFGFGELARDYVGREPTPVEAAGVLIKLHAAPMYFYRRGRGRFQAAPENQARKLARDHACSMSSK